MFGLTDTDLVVADLRHKATVGKAERRARIDWDQGNARRSGDSATSMVAALKVKFAGLFRQHGRSLPAGS